MDRSQQSNNTKNEKTTAKKVIPRKLLVIKQTLTSLYRIAKANPLLVFKDETLEEQGNDYGLSNIKLPRSVLLPNTGSRCYTESSASRSNFNTNEQKPRTLAQLDSIKVNKEKPKNVHVKRTNSLKIKPSTVKLEPKQGTRYIPQHSKALKPVATAKRLRTPTETLSVLKPPVTAKKSTKQEKRRSLSAEHYDRKKALSKMKTEQSPEFIRPLNDVGKKTAPISPIVEDVRTVTFKTPTAYKRRSVSMTSITPTPYHKHFTSTPLPTLNDLGQRLKEWLQRHKKPVDSYKHLKCFGFHNSHSNKAQLDDENKENKECLTDSTSYENLHIIPEISVTAAKDLSLTIGNGYADNRTIAQDALTDLHKLILDGYPHQQCEAWLGMIRQKCMDLDEEPQYWECRAAIEQTRGNITSAVECLRTAIVQGAEVNTVDQSLEQLLQKFSLLNISADQEKNNLQKIDRARIVLDARSVFKSSIIQFAIQERTLKNKQKQEGPTSEKKFLATPVRRSTRQNRSIYTSTPSVQLCSSLKELDENVSSNLDFCGNIALYR